MSSETLQIFVRLQDQFGRKMSDRKRGVIFSDHLFETIPINYWDEVRQTGPEMKKQVSCQSTFDKVYVERELTLCTRPLFHSVHP